MNELTIFKNEEFGEIRTVMIDDELWFVGKDVASVLGYQNSNRDINRHVDEDDRKMLDGETQYRFGIELGQRGGWLINESGLYSLIMSSKLPSAKKFKKWVTSEVLPTIRKTGNYSLNNAEQHKATLLLSIYNGGQEGVLASKELTKIEIEEATLPLKQEIAQQQETISVQDNTITEQKKEIKTMKPKANYFDIVMQCKDLVSTTDIAKDYGWSAVKLNNFLKSNKIQYKRGNTWYLYQKYSEKGYSSTKTNIYYGKDGQDHAKVHMY